MSKRKTLQATAYRSIQDLQTAFAERFVDSTFFLFEESVRYQAPGSGLYDYEKAQRFAEDVEVFAQVCEMYYCRRYAECIDASDRLYDSLDHHSRRVTK